MSAHKAVVETYFEGFRRRDHAQILACLTDDVIWDIYGHVHLIGKEAFDREIERPDATEGPILTIDRLIEEADTVVALGIGEGSQPGGERFRFYFCTVCTFAGDKIGRIESSIVPLKEGE
ncbi:MAG: nuclear transport factor 2 family protein [Thermomicrobiales bacterium]